MQHSCLINGYDTLNLTKLDILDELPEIKVATKYLIDGKELEGFPGEPLVHTCHYTATDFLATTADLCVLQGVDVEYVTLPGWQSSITSVTSYDGLPENCKKYIEFIEEFLKVPIEWIGVGPGRESMLKKEVK